MEKVGVCPETSHLLFLFPLYGPGWLGQGNEDWGSYRHISVVHSQAIFWLFWFQLLVASASVAIGLLINVYEVFLRPNLALPRLIFHHGHPKGHLFLPSSPLGIQPLWQIINCLAVLVANWVVQLLPFSPPTTGLPCEELQEPERFSASSKEWGGVWVIYSIYSVYFFFSRHVTYSFLQPFCCSEPPALRNLWKRTVCSPHRLPNPRDSWKTLQKSSPCFSLFWWQLLEDVWLLQFNKHTDRTWDANSKF